MTVETLSGPPSTKTGDGEEFPQLAPLLAEIGEQLEQCGTLGLLSVSVLRGQSQHEDDDWVDYQSILAEVAAFLRASGRRRMRPTDRLLEPITAGNSLIILLGPPRSQRSLDHSDLARVRHRIWRGMNEHVAARVAAESIDRYGIFVGSALIRSSEHAAPERIIYRAIDEAFANALGQRNLEQVRRSLYLHRILKRRAIDAVFQPIVDMTGRRVLGYEALTRSRHRRFRSPEELFATAGENGSLWNLERLCRERALESLPPLDDDQRVFLNIEPRSCSDPQLHGENFLEAVRRAGLEPGRVVFEITEHAAVSDFDALRRTLDRLRSMGFRLAMDDVGSGHSNLRAISELRPDYVKVDMSLVRDLHLDPMKRQLIETIRRLTENTGIAMVAEGVESRAEMNALITLGVQCAQGYLFARPGMPPDEPDWETLTCES